MSIAGISWFDIFFIDRGRPLYDTGLLRGEEGLKKVGEIGIQIRKSVWREGDDKVGSKYVKKFRGEKYG